MRYKTKHRPNHKIKIDLIGFMAPVAVLHADQEFRRMKAGEVLELLNCNHETMRMFLRLFPKSSYELLSDEKMHRSSSLYRILLKKTRDI